MKFRLHTKFIIILISVSLIPLILVAGVTLVRFQRTLSNEAGKLGNQLAATAAAEIRTFMVSQFGILENIAALYHPDFPIDDAQAERLLEIMLLRSENFMDISVVGKDGKELVRKNRLLVVTSGDLRDVQGSEAFSIVQRDGIYVGPVYIQSGRPFFDFGRKISDSRGTFAGAVFAQVDARIMPEVVANISRIVQPPGRVFLVNENGTVIAHPDLSYVLAQRDLRALPPVQSVAEGAEGDIPASTYENETGVRVLGTAHPLTIELFDLRQNTSSRIDWYVITEQPEDAVYGESKAAAAFSIAISLFAVLLAGGTAIYFAGRVAHPIESLHRATLEFGKGNFGSRATVETSDEIGDLAQSFNTTADALSKTVASLKDEERVTAAERDKLRLILTGITNAVVAVDLKGSIVLFNKAAEVLTGHAASSVYGKPLKEIVRLYEGEREVAPEEYSPSGATNAEGVVFRKNELLMKSAKGEEHIVNVVSGRIREGDRIQLGCVITFQDITREAIMERTKREFVSIAAHQLRTPLTGMKWTVESLLSDAKGTLSAAQTAIVGQAMEATRRMIDLVDDLLDVSRIEEGRFGVKPKKQPIAPVIKRVVDDLRPQAARKSVTLNAEVQEDLPEIEFDDDKIQFAISNLVDNAIKYSESGGSVRVRAALHGREIVISVQDSGIGIPASEQDRVFSKFYRSQKALLFHTDGSGLGLYVAKNIVDKHGGRISFSSKEGKGTEFTIALNAPAVHTPPRAPSRNAVLQ